MSRILLCDDGFLFRMDSFHGFLGLNGFKNLVENFAGKVHKDFTNRLKVAKVWGEAVFDGQMVQRDHVLQEGDIVELHI